MDYDVIIIGTGAGGGTLAYALEDCGARVLMLERGSSTRRAPHRLAHLHEELEPYCSGRS
ncbi:MAG TPA: FAD-binding protein [Burkholderiaceae bacterium]|nr:FAD-binding protein [Burkholderiaceae bacterium]